MSRSMWVPIWVLVSPSLYSVISQRNGSIDLLQDHHGMMDIFTSSIIPIMKLLPNHPFRCGRAQRAAVSMRCSRPSYRFLLRFFILINNAGIMGDVINISSMSGLKGMTNGEDFIKTSQMWALAEGDAVVHRICRAGKGICRLSESG